MRYYATIRAWIEILTSRRTILDVCQGVVQSQMPKG